MSEVLPVRRFDEPLVLGTLCAVQFTHIMDYMIMMPLGAPLMRVFDITPAQFSALVASYSIAAAVTGLIGGFLMDRYDRKTALVALYAGFAVATLACALATNYYLLLAARIVAGAFGGVAGSVVVAAVGDVVPAERRGTAMGIVMTAFPLASVLGVPVGLTLASRFSWQSPFYLLAGVAALVGAFVIRYLPSLPPHDTTVHPWRQMKAILSHPIHHRGFMLSAALVFAGGCVIPFMAPSMVTNVGLTEDQLPLIYLAGGACTFFSMQWIGRLSDRHDKLVVLGWITLAAIVSVLILTNLGPASVAAALLITSAFMVSMSGRFPPAMSMITNAVESRYRGGFMSVNSAVQQGFSALGNSIAGLVIVRDAATGRLERYGVVGLVAVVAFGLAVYFAARLRAAAPDSARPARRLVPATPGR